MKFELTLERAKRQALDIMDDLLRCNDVYRLTHVMHKASMEFGYLYTDSKELVDEMEELG